MSLHSRTTHLPSSPVMAAPPHGTAFLSSVARLEQRRTTPGNLMPITFDAVLPCRNNAAISPILCNARYGPDVEQGIYHVCMKIVPYQPNVHLPSPTREHGEFTFLGEIVDLHRLNLPIDFNIIQTDIRSLLTVTGNVSTIDPLDNSFTVALTQNIAGHPGTLTVHTVTTQPNWPDNDLPTLNERVSFSAELFTVDFHEPVVLLDEFTNVVNAPPAAAVM
ncbi:hypothetical protein V8E53_001491 [Lactarius tabidus]